MTIISGKIHDIHDPLISEFQIPLGPEEPVPVCINASLADGNPSQMAISSRRTMTMPSMSPSSSNDDNYILGVEVKESGSGLESLNESKLRRFRVLPSISTPTKLYNQGCDQSADRNNDTMREAELEKTIRNLRRVPGYTILIRVLKRSDLRALESSIATFLLQNPLLSSVFDISQSSQSPSSNRGIMDDFPIKCMSWHPESLLLALAHRQDVIFLFDMVSSRWMNFNLADERQRGIQCMQWAPKLDNVLVVGCKDGFCLWLVNSLHSRMNAIPEKYSQSNAGLKQKDAALDNNYYKSSNPSSSGLDELSQMPQRGKQPSSNLMKFYAHESLKNISGLCISPTSSFIVFSSSDTSNIYLWHMDRQVWQEIIISPTKSFGTQDIKISNDGMYIVLAQERTSTSGGICSGIPSFLRKTRGQIVIVETFNWNELSIEFPAEVRNLNWLPDSRALLFNLSGEKTIRTLYLTKPFPDLSYKFDKTEVLETQEFAYGQTCSGAIDKMVLSPSGTRLIISFHKNGGSTQIPGSNYLLVMNVRPFGIAAGVGLAPINNQIFLEIGFIHGPLPVKSSNDEFGVAFANLISFSQFYDRGDLAAISWENGRISFFPIFHS